MPKLTFYLKEPKSSKDSAIYFLYTCRDGRLKYYTGESGNKSNFPGKLNKGTKAILSRITATVELAEVDARIKGEPLTKASLSSLVDSKLGRSSNTPGQDFFSAANLVIDKMKSGQLLTPGKKNKYGAGTIRTKEHTLSVLQQFNPNLKTDDITLDTYRQFIVWCHGRDYSTNYIGTLVKNWKQLGQDCSENPVFTDKAFKKISEETWDIYLDDAEIKKMLGVPVNKRESLARDWFIIGCYNGMRISDLLHLDEKNLGTTSITVANEKTGFKVVVPIHPQVRKILKKHGGFPRRITDVEINRQIKLVAKRAGLTEKVLYSITKGGSRQDYFIEKWQMCSSHTMRRTFITNMLKKGYPESIVMSLAGIRSYATLKKYNKLTPNEAATIAIKMNFDKL